MRLPFIPLLLVTAAFAAYTAYVIWQVGYIGIFTGQFHVAGMQVLLDLVIVCGLAILWMIQDARRSGRQVWPYVLLTLTAGSFGPLIYLLLGSRSAEQG
ncbi:MAG: hypothetical protein ACPHCJ_06325 [Oceanococcaceae bacterium]